MPPDLSGMLFAAPWFGFGRIIAYNMALLTQVSLAIWAGGCWGVASAQGLSVVLRWGFHPSFSHK